MAMLKDFPGVEARGDFLKIHFTWPNHPPGYPRRQKARTHLPNRSENYAAAYGILSLIEQLLQSPGGLSEDDYVRFLPEARFSLDKKNKSHLEKVTFFEALSLYRDYCDHLIKRNVESPETLRRYLRCLGGINLRPLHKTNLCDLTRKDFHNRQLGWEGHRQFLQQGERPKKPKTVNNIINAIKHFGKWVETNNLIEGEPPWDALEYRKTSSPPPPVFSTKQMTDIYIDLYQNESRDAANAFALLCLLGCRVGEVLSIAAEDLKHPISKSEIEEREKRNYPITDLEKVPRIEIRRSLALRQVDLTPAEIEAQRALPLANGKMRSKVDKSRTAVFLKDTKTRDVRVLELDPVTLEIIEEQIDAHASHGPSTYRVQVDDRVESQQLSFLIWTTRSAGRSTTRSLFHGADAFGKAFRRTRKRLNQTGESMPAAQKARNTKASIMASNGEPMIKIRAQLGHGADTQTLEKHYAKWVMNGERIDLPAVFRKARVQAKATVRSLKVVGSH